MRKSSIFIFFFACFHFSSLAVLSQKTNDILTNAHVIKMVKAEIPDATIILVIQQSETNFDTSAETLIELNNLGIRQKILEAMIKPRPTKPESPNAVEDFEDPSPNEVFMIEGEKRFPIQRVIFNTRFFRGFPFFGAAKTYQILDGARSKLRISDTTPEFEASLPSDLNPTNLLNLVKLDQKSDRREIKISNVTLVRSKDKFGEKATVPTKFEVVKTYTVNCGTKYNLYRVKVINPLAPGEYAFASRSTYTIYDFGID